jgi:hypothetical protein
MVPRVGALSRRGLRTERFRCRPGSWDFPLLRWARKIAKAVTAPTTRMGTCRGGDIVGDIINGYCCNVLNVEENRGRMAGGSSEAGALKSHGR